MNILEESSDHRSPVQYHKILTGLTNVIKNRSDQYFSFTQDKGWNFDIDAIAAYLAQRYPENELLFQPHLKSSYISIHFSDLVAKTEFTNDILKLLAALREGVLKGIGKQLHQPDISGA